MAQSSTNAGNAKQPRTKSFVQSYLTNCRSFYSCIHCRAHLANHDDLVSRSFQGNHSRAYLFNSLMNVTCGQAVNRELNTGTHAVADIFCSNCNTLIGWKYEKAYVESQKYKEGKYIIELSHVLRENKHLELERGEKILNRTRGSNSSSTRVCNSRGSSFSQNTNHVNKRLSIYNKRNSLSDSTPTSSPEIATSPSTSQELPGSHGVTNMNGVNSKNLETKFQQLSTNDIDNNNYYSSEDDDYDDDDGDELIFPFYDDLCADLLIYPGGLSSNHKRLTQKYIYTSSEPYDWKHLPSPSSTVTKSPNLDIKEASSGVQTSMKEVSTDSVIDEDEHKASSQVDSEKAIQSDDNSEVTISSSMLDTNDKNDNRIDEEIFISTENIASNHRLASDDAESKHLTTTRHLVNNDEDEFFDCFQ